MQVIIINQLFIPFIRQYPSFICSIVARHGFRGSGTGPKEWHWNMAPEQQGSQQNEKPRAATAREEKKMLNDCDHVFNSFYYIVIIVINDYNQFINGY